MSTKIKTRPATEAEVHVLKRVLREMRYAVATRQQLQVTFDPWSLGGGANVFFGYSCSGSSESVEGEFRGVKSKRAATK